MPANSRWDLIRRLRVNVPVHSCLSCQHRMHGAMCVQGGTPSHRNPLEHCDHCCHKKTGWRSRRSVG